MKHNAYFDVSEHGIGITIADRPGRISDALQVRVGFDTAGRPFVLISRGQTTGYGIQVQVDGERVVNRV